MVSYFELYDIPESFSPDAQLVKSKYYELSRKNHPDRFATADDASRADALRMAALNNDAYRTLNNADATMAYILKLHGVLEDEEKYNLPPAFLMEMMDLNEAISEYEMDRENTAAKDDAMNTLSGHLSDWAEGLNPFLQKFDEGDRSNTVLQAIKDYYFRKKYLLRIQERIDTFATR